MPKQTDDRGFLLEMLPKHSIGAEIGVHLGDFSAQLLATVQPNTLHLIDPWAHLTSTVYKTAWYGGAAKGGQEEMDERYDAVCRRFREQIQTGQVQVNRGFSTDILGQFADGYLDWVYIDGNHLYEYVIKDLELSLRKTRTGGFVTGDDYTEGGWWSGGVKKAVDQFQKNVTAVQMVALRDKQYIFRKLA
jgi:hypothetical protein